MKSEYVARQLALGSGIALTGRFLGRILSAAGDIAAARILGPAVFGVYGVGWTIFRLVELVAPLGFDVGVLRFGAQHVRDGGTRFQSVVRQTILAPAGFGLLIGAACYGFAPWLAVQLFHKPDLIFVLRFLVIAFPCAALLPAIGSALRLTAIMKYAVIVQDLGQPLVALLLLLLFYAFSMRLTGVLLSDVLSYAICVGLGLYFLGRIFPRVFQRNPAGGTFSRELTTFSLESSLVAIFSTWIFWADRLIVAYYRSAQETGVYQAASQLSVVFAVVLSGFNRIAIPMFANLNQAGDIPAVGQVFRLSTKWGLYLSVPILLVLLISPGEVISLLYGVSYKGGALVLGILVVGQLFNLITGPVGPLLMVTGHQRLVLGLSMAALILNGGLLYGLVPAFGTVGASVATSASLVLFFGACLVAARIRLRVWPYDRHILKGLAAALVTAILLVLIKQALWRQPPVLLVAVQATVAAGAFGALLYLMKLDDEDKMLIKTVCRPNGF